MTQQHICLLVGGPADGRRVAVAQGSPVLVMEDRVHSSARVFGSQTVHQYRLQQFHESGKVHSVYFHNSIQENFLLTLIRGYQRQGS